MVTSVGEAAVSGISLVDLINILFIQVFSALASGGAIVTAQYLGRQERKNACIAAKQLLYVIIALARDHHGSGADFSLRPAAADLR